MGSVCNKQEMKPVSVPRVKKSFDAGIFKKVSNVSVIGPIPRRGSSFLSNEIPITTHQSRLIVKSWSTISDYEEFGRHVFLEIFMLKPNLKRLFHLESFSDSDILEAEGFRCHAANFGKFLGVMVDGVKDTDSKTNGGHQRIIKTANAIGAAHLGYTRGIKFDTDYWQLFICAVNSQFRPYFVAAQMSPTVHLETEEAWSALLVFFVDKMKNAYLRMLQEEYNKLTVQMHRHGSNNASRAEIDPDSRSFFLEDNTSFIMNSYHNGQSLIPGTPTPTTPPTIASNSPKH